MLLLRLKPPPELELQLEYRCRMFSYCAGSVGRQLSHKQVDFFAADGSRLTRSFLATACQQSERCRTRLAVRFPSRTPRRIQSRQKAHRKANFHGSSQ
jgi:hypothetical protein